jgi:hypothetical protein
MNCCSFFVVADTFCVYSCSTFRRFPHTACALPLPDSSRTAVISIDGSVVESGTRSTAFPRAVLRHLARLLLLLLAGCNGACLLMIVMMMELETTG